MPKVQFKGVATEFVPVPEGTYEAVFTGFKAQKAKDDSDMYNLEFTIAEDELKGRKLFRNFSLKDQALWSFKKTLIKLGVDPEELEDEVDIDEILDELKGTEVTLDVTQREHEDKTYNDFEIVSESE